MQLTSQEQFYTDQTMDTKQLGQFIEQLEQLPTLIDPRLALAAALPGPLFPIDS